MSLRLQGLPSRRREQAEAEEEEEGTRAPVHRKLGSCKRARLKSEVQDELLHKLCKQGSEAGLRRS